MVAYELSLTSTRHNIILTRLRKMGAFLLQEAIQQRVYDVVVALLPYGSCRNVPSCSPHVVNLRRTIGTRNIQGGQVLMNGVAMCGRLLTEAAEHRIPTFLSGLRPELRAGESFGKILHRVASPCLSTNSRSAVLF